MLSFRFDRAEQAQIVLVGSTEVRSESVDSEQAALVSAPYAVSLHDCSRCLAYCEQTLSVFLHFVRA